MQRRILGFEQFQKLNEANDSADTVARLSKYLKEKLWKDSTKLMYGSDYTGDPAADSRTVKVREEDVTMGEIFKDAWEETDQFCDTAAAIMINGTGGAASTDSLSYLMDKLLDKQGTVSAVKKVLEQSSDFEADWGLDAYQEGLKQMPGIPNNRNLPNGAGEIGYYFTYKMAEYAYDWFSENVKKALGAASKAVADNTAPAKSGERTVNYKALADFFTKKVGKGEVRDGKLVKKSNEDQAVQTIIDNFYGHIHRWKTGEYGNDVNKLLSSLKNSMGSIWVDSYWQNLDDIINNRAVDFSSKPIAKSSGGSSAKPAKVRDTSDIKIDDEVVAGYGL